MGPRSEALYNQRWALFNQVLGNDRELEHRSDRIGAIGFTITVIPLLLAWLMFDLSFVTVVLIAVPLMWATLVVTNIISAFMTNRNNVVNWELGKRMDTLWVMFQRAMEEEYPISRPVVSVHLRLYPIRPHKKRR